MSDELDIEKNIGVKTPNKINKTLSSLATGFLIMIIGFILIGLSFVDKIDIPIIAGAITSFTGIGILSITLIYMACVVHRN